MYDFVVKCILSSSSQSELLKSRWGNARGQTDISENLLGLIVAGIEPSKPTRRFFSNGYTEMSVKTTTMRCNEKSLNCPSLSTGTIHTRSISYI